MNTGIIKQIPYLSCEEGLCEWGTENTPLYTCVCTYNYQCRTEHIQKLTLSPNHDLFTIFLLMHSFHRLNLPFPPYGITFAKIISVRWDRVGGRCMWNSSNATAPQYLLGFHSNKSYEALGVLACRQFQLWWFVIQ